MSDAEAVTVVVPETVAPFAGAVIEVVGGVVSGSGAPSSRVKLRGSPDAASSFGPWCTPPSAETVKRFAPSVVILMLPTQ